MHRILVMGRQGSGKSTFAKKLGQKLGTEVIHLDNHFHKNGWQRVTKEEWKNIQSELVKGKSWVIDGTYLSSIVPRLEVADTLIMLEIPLWLSIYRALRRYKQHRGGKRPDFKDGLHERITLRFIKKMLTFSTKNVLEKVKRYPNVKIIKLRNEKEIESFLSKVCRE